MTSPFAKEIESHEYKLHTLTTMMGVSSDIDPSTPAAVDLLLKEVLELKVKESNWFLQEGQKDDTDEVPLEADL